MGRAGSDEIAFEQTWQMLNLPEDGADLPPDATIVAVPSTSPPRVLPRIAVVETGDSVGHGADAAPATSVGPDLVVIRALGEGGMGRVQLARQRSLERDVALKRPRVGGNAASARAIREEALLTGYLEHPNIIPVHALGHDDSGQPLIVMKRVEGVSWRELLYDDQHPGWTTREPALEGRLVWHLQTLAQLCNAIAFAHSRGIVHRDIKPDNVMIGEFGEVYQLDWGVATEVGGVTRTTDGRPALVGTPSYMAPEMVRGAAIDQRTDVYLLGATLHEILARRVRHVGKDLYAVTMSAFLSAPVTYGDDVPDELAELANRATSREPDDRPQSALAFRNALMDHLRHRGSLSMSVAADERLAEAMQAIRNRDSALPIERWIEECRVGFVLALRSWSDNPQALRGLERSSEALIRVELLRRNAGAARAALDGLSHPSQELIDAVAALESELAAADQERDLLRQLAHDVDPGLGARMQLLVLAVLLLISVGVAAFVLTVDHTGRGMGPAQLLLPPALIVIAMVTTIAATGRRFLVNAFNRRLAAWFILSTLVLMFSRVVGVAMGFPGQTQHVIDGVVLAGFLSTGAVYVFRWVWVCALLVAAGALFGALVPELGVVAFSISILSAIGFGIIMQRRRT